MKTDQMQLLELIHAYLDECATDQQARQLNDRLRTDAAARDLYLQLADTHSCLAVDESLWMEYTGNAVASESQVHLAHRPWVAWRPLAAAAAGIVFGMFCTSVVFAYVSPSLVRVKIALIEGFESGVSKTGLGLPRELAVWGGDSAEVVASAPGVKPHTGDKMLRFLSATYPGENSPRSQWSDVYRLVDVRGMAGGGRTVARLSARFAQGAVSGHEQFSSSVEAFALDQELSMLPSPLTYAWIVQNNSASGSRRHPLSVASGWQEVAVEVPITPATRSVLLHLAVIQSAPVIQAGAVEFPCQYVDDVKVEIISRP